MSLSSRSHAISVAIMAWNDEHRAFVIETYLKKISFEEERTVTVTSQRYLQMLCNFLEPRLNELGYASLWFQQDGVTAHTATASMEVLRENFSGRLISLRGEIPWPARSPDLSPCDLFL
jgi:hypothetical protein